MTSHQASASLMCAPFDLLSRQRPTVGFFSFRQLPLPGTLLSLLHALRTCSYVVNSCEQGNNQAKVYSPNPPRAWIMVEAGKPRYIAEPKPSNHWHVYHQSEQTEEQKRRKGHIRIPTISDVSVFLPDEHVSLYRTPKRVSTEKRAR